MRKIALIAALALMPLSALAADDRPAVNEQLLLSIRHGLAHYGIRADLEKLTLSQAVELNFLLDSSEGRGALNRLRKKQRILHLLRKADAL
ncbi:hypothetical protein [Ovoidimarina sediminis]|uniref:hypothetical protein n=1 Tax=Ovoidimarina sediminis TaxID=3079856 RepID=UPI00290B3D5E|nr:hypothetical protein [Rhodophyticola sp. MJ-SS7]MDU8943966.1 hypothetical protein [Rhodophyticola sp. MJ-SS7]